MDLTPRDLAMFKRFGVGPELLAMARIQRVTDREARDLLAINGMAGDMAGVFFPYLNPKTGYRQAGRVRRDCPEVEDGKPKNKYIAGYGDRRHLYVVPGSESLLADLTVPVILVEAEKSALALWALAQRTAKRFVPVGLGGCWGWHGKIGKRETADGKTVDEKGPLPDLAVCRDGRKVYVLLDANCATNSKVQAARSALRRQLRKQKADVRLLDLPTGDGINGPDDFIAVRGDEAMRAVLEGPEADWKARLIRKPPTKAQQAENLPGSPMALLENAMVALRDAAEWRGVLAFNEFSLHTVTREAAPWPESKPGADWTGYDDAMTAGWLHRNGIYVSSVVAAEAAETVAHENSFHPVKDYLESLKWDDKARIDHWMTTYLGVKDGPFVQAVGARWLISAVARIYQPGCQCDHVLMLEGEQGARKSTALRILASDPWFVDHTSELGSKDSRLEVHGKWIIEMSELDRIRRGELEAVKAYLVTRIDHIRPPYGRRTEDIPRSCVFAATTNSGTSLVDETGNRRFWPVRCGAIDIDRLTAERDQLWAEAYQRYKDQPVWWLDTSELEHLATDEQEERYDPGVWDQVILEWANNPTQRYQVERRSDGTVVQLPIEPFDSTSDEVTVTDVLLHAIGKPLDRCLHGDKLQVVKCLVHSKWERRQKGTKKDRKWFYFRPKDDSDTRDTS